VDIRFRAVSESFSANSCSCVGGRCNAADKPYVRDAYYTLVDNAEHKADVRVVHNPKRAKPTEAEKEMILEAMRLGKSVRTAHSKVAWYRDKSGAHDNFDKYASECVEELFPSLTDKLQNAVDPRLFARRQTFVDPSGARGVPVDCAF
jgi:hypothetical protein